VCDSDECGAQDRYRQGDDNHHHHRKNEDADEASDASSGDDEDADPVSDDEDDEDVLLPVKLERLSNEKVTDISVGRHHCMALTKFGDVFAWGYHEVSALHTLRGPAPPAVFAHRAL
jgi:alpha-tubulin suppressor-like RCC1 family protein